MSPNCNDILILSMLYNPQRGLGYRKIWGTQLQLGVAPYEEDDFNFDYILEKTDRVSSCIFG